MSLELYGTPTSGPCRAVRLTAEALNLKLTVIPLDLQKGEHLKPEFLKLNPQHTVPTLKDNEFVLWESRAITAYLVNKYGGRDDNLYPKDPKVRGLIDQRLYFDALVLLRALQDLYYPMFLSGVPMTEENLKKAQDALTLFDVLLDNPELYVAGDNITIADLSLVATVATFDGVGFDLTPYKRVLAWYKRVQENAKGYEETKPDLEAYKTLVKNIMDKSTTTS